MVYVVLFAILFFGMIIGFFAWMWWNEKHRKHDRYDVTPTSEDRCAGPRSDPLHYRLHRISASGEGG